MCVRWCEQQGHRRQQRGGDDSDNDASAQRMRMLRVICVTGETAPEHAWILPCEPATNA